MSATATKSAPKKSEVSGAKSGCKLVCLRAGRNNNPFRRSVPATGSADGYLLTFLPGVPVVLNEREVQACAKDISKGLLESCEISQEHLLGSLAEFADVFRDSELGRLRNIVGRLVGELKCCGVTQAAIDDMVSNP